MTRSRKNPDSSSIARTSESVLRQIIETRSSMKRILVSWSSGKDCAWALHLLRRQPGIEIVGLLTTINSEFDRVAMHGTHSAVLEAQASAADLPLWKVPLPWPCSNEEYERRMADVCLRAASEGIDAI